VNPALADVILSFLIREEPLRLGCSRNGFVAIARHPFFEGVNWEEMENRRIPAPWIPTLIDESDSSKFQIANQDFTENKTTLNDLFGDGQVSEAALQVFKDF